MSGALPTFVIVGVQKCGTTALHAYLSRHPEISMSSPKELDYFIAERNLAKGEDWYRERFDPAFAVRGESSPNYTAHPTFPGVPERMAALVPDAKLVFMVRDPVDRVRAGYYHRYSNRVEHRPMREAIRDPGESYVTRSLYHLQLTRFLEHYPMDQILVLEQNELRDERRETLRRVYGFLGVERTDYWRQAFNEPRLESAARGRRTRLGRYLSTRMPRKLWRRVKHRRLFQTPYEQAPMDADLRAEVADLLREDTAAFRQLTGRRFENWSV